MDDLVPSKMSSSQIRQPWIDTTVKRLAKRKQKPYKKAKLSNQEKGWNYYKKLKHIDQHECRRAYHEYVEDMGKNFDDNPRKFWRFVCEVSVVKTMVLHP